MVSSDNNNIVNSNKTNIGNFTSPLFFVIVQLYYKQNCYGIF